MAPYPPPAGGVPPLGQMPPPGYPPSYYPPPGYAPYPGTMPPPRSSTGKVILIVVAVLVVVFLVLPIVLFLLISGMAPPHGAPQRPELVLTPGTWNNGNLTISIASVTNAPNLEPSDLAYGITAADGTSYFSGPAGQGAAVSGTAVALAFDDNVAIGHVSAGDAIRLTVDPSSSARIRGGSLSVFFSGDPFAVTSLP